MPSPTSAPNGPTPLFARRNFYLLGVAVVTIAAGYGALEGNSPGLASFLLVMGYCILFPIALIV
ncbi:MAG TPA: hypothetical protein VHW65_09920 [Gemmatimonadales bacterium]|nr:hypothetical protein [Gemmatimonadales bacterium]